MLFVISIMLHNAPHLQEIVFAPRKDIGFAVCVCVCVSILNNALDFRDGMDFV